MKTVKATSRKCCWPPRLLACALCLLIGSSVARAVTTVFFDITQTTNLVTAGATSDTISSEGYLFTFSRDKFFTGGTTNPPGRYVRVFWPDGLEAQAVTVGPAPSKARIIIKRQDGQAFAITTLTAKLLANTAGAGGAIEVMPLLNGQDGFNEPLMCQASGYYGQMFSYDTPTLTGFDEYDLTLYVDYALMGITLVDATIPDPVLAISQVDAAAIEISWPTNAPGYALESATSLTATVWSPVTNSISITADQFTVRLGITGFQCMYRLRK